ncbi:MAG: hypothetical protein ACI9GW_001354, partial [Halieaceae bacterium]
TSHAHPTHIPRTSHAHPTHITRTSHAHPTHIPHTSLHLKRVPEEYRHLPADLAKVISAWDELSEDAKRQILEIIEGGA